MTAKVRFIVALLLVMMIASANLHIFSEIRVSFSNFFCKFKTYSIIYFIYCRNTVVNSYYEINIFFFQMIDRSFIHTVAFTVAVRNIEHHIRKNRFKVRKKNSR